MKTRNSIYAFFLALALASSLLPAAALGETAAQGTYSESLLVLPEGYTSITAITVRPDGAMAAAAKQGDTGAWALLVWTDISAAPGIAALDHTGGDITQVAYAPDGSLLVISNDMKLPPEPPEGQDGGPQMQAGGQRQETAGERTMIRSMDDMSSTAAWFDADGTMGGSFQIKGLVTQAAALSGRQTAVLGMQSGITIYDEKGNSIKQITGSGTMGNGIVSIAASGETLFALSSDKLTQYDVKSGQKVATAELKADFSSRAAIGPDGTAYVMDSTGLYAVKPGDSRQTMLMDAIGTLVGDPNNGISGIAVMKDGTIIVLIAEGGGSLGGGGRSVRIGGMESYVLAAYRYTGAAGAGTRRDFTITSLYSSAKLRKAAGDFQRLHPELNVKLQAQLAEGDDSPVEDRIRTLNTDLLAGKGGDVLILDGLPAEKYAQRGILKDLSSLLQDIAFLPGIREGSAFADGKLYAMPAKFSFELLWGKADTVNAIQTLEDLPALPLASGQTLLHPRTYEEWLRMFYPASEPQFRNESGQLQFDSPAFEAFLETLYQLYIRQGDIPSENMPQAKGGIAPAEVAAMLNGAAALFPASVNSLMELNIAYTISGGQESGFAALPSLNSMGYGYVPSLMAGINAQSQNQALAEEFLLLLYSPDIQALDQMDGLPTVAASLDKQFDDALARNQGGKKMVAMFALPGMNPIEAKQPDEQICQKLRTLCDQLNIPVRTDETLLHFITDETEAFFAGSITAQAAAQAVQQRAWAYLNE